MYISIDTTHTHTQLSCIARMCKQVQVTALNQGSQHKISLPPLFDVSPRGEWFDVKSSA